MIDNNTPTEEDIRKLWRLGWKSKDEEDGAVLFALEVLDRWGCPRTESCSSGEPPCEARQITLSAEDQVQLAEALLNPMEPNEALRGAKRAYEENVVDTTKGSEGEVRYNLIMPNDDSRSVQVWCLENKGDTIDLYVSVDDNYGDLKELARDAVSGLRYIEDSYGRLYGVGWDRVFSAADKLIPSLDTQSKTYEGKEKEAE
jgi:hypothetical protein